MYGVLTSLDLPPKLEDAGCRQELGALQGSLQPGFGGRPQTKRMENYGIGTLITNEATYSGNTAVLNMDLAYAVSRNNR